ncbi:TcmI family type II polyketide cyclase [Streptomyces sp. NPDC002054]|uniref:TcmI family type II polyketide cyclase n=1 Tax=Streptomyces sp. NPDC002054 TaxID=3154663 RepID=UPI00332F03CA
MHQALIVARMAPQSADDIARVFAESDAGELPHLVGVTRRSLFQFGDVYLHLFETPHPPGPEVAKHTSHPLFQDISEQLSSYVRPYDPATWRSPSDAMARQFYSWQSGR